MVLLKLADQGFHILEVVNHHLHHLHHLCHLQALDCVSAAWIGRPPGRRQRATFAENSIGRIRRMRQHYIQSAQCHGIKQGRNSLRPFCCNLRAASSNATDFQSCNACSLLQQLLLPAMAASCAMRSSAHLRRANQAHCAAISERRATRRLLANAPITIRQLRDCVHIAVSMAAGFLEDSNQSLARVQAQTLPVHRHR